MQKTIMWKTHLAECEVQVDGEQSRFIGRVSVDGTEMFEISGRTLPQLRRDFELSCHLLCVNA